MGYPEAPLGMRLEVAPGADLSADPSTYTWVPLPELSMGDPITSKVGGEDEQAQGSTNLTWAIVDPDGRYDIDNGESDLWPYFDLNCPIRWSLDTGSGFQPQLIQYLSEANPDVRSANLALRKCRADGILRRLQQGADPKSAARRTIVFAEPQTYLPLEDAAGATQAGSAIGGTPGAVVGTVAFGSTGAVPAGGACVADFGDGGTVTVTTGLSGVLSSWEMEISFGFGSLPDISGGVGFGSAILARAACPGSNVDNVGFGIVQDSVGVIRPAGFYTLDGGTAVVLFNVVDDILEAGVTCHMRLVVTQSGGNVDLRTYRDGAVHATTNPPGTVYAPKRIVLNGGLYILAGAGAKMSHLAVWSPKRSTGATDTASAVAGWVGEQAHERIERLCAEESVPVTTTATRSTLMGAQPVGALVPLLRECEATDHGLLNDSQGSVGFRALSEMHNQDVALTIDAAARQLYLPIAPVRDDQKVRNRIRASRPAGSEAIVSDAESIAAIAAYDSQVSVNVYRDDQLPHEAGWAVWQGTAPGKRWPALTLKLHASPELVADFMALTPGDRIRIVNQPRSLGRGDVDLIAIGWTATHMGRRRWQVTINCLPYRHDVFTIETGTGNRSRLGSHTATLSAATGATETSWTVTDGRLWTTTATYPNDFPFDVGCDGEQVRVTSIVGGALPQTWTVTRAINGVRKAHASGAEIRLWQPAVLGL